MLTFTDLLALSNDHQIFALVYHTCSCTAAAQLVTNVPPGTTLSRTTSSSLHGEWLNNWRHCFKSSNVYTLFFSCSVLNMGLQRFTKSLNLPTAHIFKSFLMYLAHEFLLLVLRWFGLFGASGSRWGFLRWMMLWVINNELGNMLKKTAVV
jgi:hypothetical protein